MRDTASILHLDLDAFFAAVEQRDKPSLRGKPVVVGGVGPRGVVATASYEARRYGVHSAMSTAEARRRCPHAAFLTGRFGAYQATSRQVMAELAKLSPLVEPLSLDEAYVDLAAGDVDDFTLTALESLAYALKERIVAATGGVTASVGIGTSKLIAKIASDLNKPDGLTIVGPDEETALLAPMHVSVIPGVGPATTERLRRIGVSTVAGLWEISREELIRVLGQAHGAGLFELCRARDNRPVVADRETKSISVEDTYATDHTDRRILESLVDRQATAVVTRLRKARLSGRTVTLKVRMSDFSTITRSSTLPSPTDEAVVVSRVARSLLADVDTTLGVRLLGVGVSGLADWIQDDLFGDELDDSSEAQAPAVSPQTQGVRSRQPWSPGMDVVHHEHGQGWVWGSGRGIVTVRFETSATGPGKVRSFELGDPALLPLTQPRE